MATKTDWKWRDECTFDSIIFIFLLFISLVFKRRKVPLKHIKLVVHNFDLTSLWFSSVRSQRRRKMIKQTTHSITMIYGKIFVAFSHSVDTSERNSRFVFWLLLFHQPSPSLTAFRYSSAKQKQQKSTQTQIRIDFICAVKLLPSYREQSLEWCDRKYRVYARRTANWFEWNHNRNIVVFLAALSISHFVDFSFYLILILSPRVNDRSIKKYLIDEN